MAEKAVHITTTSHPKPSVFEVIAQESLNATIHPALSRLLHFLASSRPDKWRWLAEHSDELYLLLNGLIHYYYITRHDASFSEFFYGLKRISESRGSSSTRLTTDQRNLSWICLVLLQYLKIKIERRLAIYRMELADGIIFNNGERHMKKAVCFLQAATQLLWQCSSFLQFLSYMSGNSDNQTLILRIIGLKLTYSDLQENTFSFWNSLFTPPFSWAAVSAGIISNTLTSCLELGAFFMQFLQSWQTDDNHKDIAALPAPPAPQYDSRADEIRGLCPICLHSWTVPTVLSISGYVYCFRCIMRHLQQQSKCPVSNAPATVSHIVRLYHT